MATTLQSILAAIRGADFVPTAQVNYGYTDNQPVPRIHVFDFEQVPEYDTSGVALRTSTYKVVVIDKSQDSAETLGATVDAFLNTSTNLTPKTMRNLQTAYKVHQLDSPPLYQYAAEYTYELTEDK